MRNIRILCSWLLCCTGLALFPPSGMWAEPNIVGVACYFCYDGPGYQVWTSYLNTDNSNSNFDSDNCCIMLQIIISPSPHCLFFLLAWRPNTKFALVSTKVTRPPPLKGRRNLQTTRASKPTTISLFVIWSEKLLDSLLMKNGPWNCCVFPKTSDASNS